eukprot:2468328-Prymnesium_polylepis.2
MHSSSRESSGCAARARLSLRSARSRSGSTSLASVRRQRIRPPEDAPTASQYGPPHLDMGPTPS